MREIEFQVKVTGNTPPYKWKLYRIEKGSMSMSAVIDEGNDPVEGEADSITGAAFDAQAAARSAFDRWVYANTHRVISVLRGQIRTSKDEEIDPLDPDTAPEVEYKVLPLYLD